MCPKHHFKKKKELNVLKIDKTSFKNSKVEKFKLLNKIRQFKDEKENEKFMGFN